MVDRGVQEPMPGDRPPPDPAADLGGTAGGRLPVPVAAVLLLGAGVLAVAAIFPRYLVYSGTPTRLSDSPDQWIPIAVIATAWLVASALAASRHPDHARIGAFAALGFALADFGLRLSDLGRLTTSGTSAGPGLWMLCAAWAAGASGAVLACATSRRAAPLGPADPPPRGADAAIAAGILGAAALATVAFFPSWDAYTAVSSLDPSLRYTFSLGSAFHGNPGLTIAGNVWAGVAFGLVPVVGVFVVRRRMVTVALAVGALVSLLTQIASAVVQTLETPNPSQLPLPASIFESGPQVSLQMTGWFDADFAALIILLLLLTAGATRRPAATSAPAPGLSPWAPISGWNQGVTAAAPGWYPPPLSPGYPPAPGTFPPSSGAALPGPPHPSSPAPYPGPAPYPDPHGGYPPPASPGQPFPGPAAPYPPYPPAGAYSGPPPGNSPPAPPAGSPWDRPASQSWPPPPSAPQEASASPVRPGSTHPHFTPDHPAHKPNPDGGSTPAPPQADTYETEDPS